MQKILILSGPVGQGKTTWLQNNLPAGAGGILTPVVAGKRMFLQLPEQLSWPMEAAAAETAILEVGRFRFSATSFARARKALNELAEAQPKTLVVVDEVGPLELRKQGFYPELLQLRQRYAGPQLWVVREQCVDAVVKTFSLKQPLVYQWPELDQLKSYFLRTFAKT